MNIIKRKNNIKHELTKTYKRISEETSEKPKKNNMSLPFFNKENEKN